MRDLFDWEVARSWCVKENGRRLMVEGRDLDGVVLGRDRTEGLRMGRVLIESNGLPRKTVAGQEVALDATGGVVVVEGIAEDYGTVTASSRFVPGENMPLDCRDHRSDHDKHRSNARRAQILEKVNVVF
uniref:Uncharacterized protein n=1 Tax=Compsopogon caeruleus TaxID=31354 RepID=A0A7S1T809_9RHOD|mmetsp:Transcript_12705/g.25783  ORF Transcript_12705/g.25783 Transcript_12705/m.25783 type:complete len:129 (+) Transcript_12705:80-466(+)